MPIRDNMTNKSGVLSQAPLQTYTLNDLRNDDEFNKRTTRFLQSIGEGKSSDDLFGYFRGLEYNLGDATQALFQTKKFDDQQKEDYLYLKNKFDKANVGDFVEWARTSADIGQEILTDPTVIASALFVPWTGGTSLAARLTAGKAVQTGLKVATNKAVQEGTKRGFAAMPGQVLKKPLTPVQTHAIVGIEGMTYGSTYDYLRQNRELNIGQKEDYDLSQTLTTGALGGVLGYGASFGLRHIANTPSYLKSIESRRLSKIDHNENYKPSVGEKAAEGALLAMTLFTKPTSSFLPKAKRSKTLSEVIKKFRYDAEKPIIAEAAGTTPRLTDSYSETLNTFIGNKLEGLTDIFEKYKLRELGSRDIALPFTQGAIINPLRNQTRKTRKSFFKSYRLSEKTNNDLVKYLRSGNKDGVDNNIVKAGDEIRALLDNVLKEAKDAGLDINYTKNFFPRVWLLDALKTNKPKFINQIRKDENLTVAEANDLWDRMTDLNQIEGTSAAGLSSIKASRKLLKIDDSQYGDFLDNNIENVLTDYIFQAGKLVSRKKVFGETLQEFQQRFIDKIDNELGNVGLTGFERRKLNNLYLFTTGQKGYINSPIGRFATDTIQLTTQTSLLPFAMISSLPELAVPLLTGKTGGGVYRNALRQGIKDSASEWWNGVQTAFGKEGARTDGRSLNRRELNAFNRSVDMAREDRAAAIYGQAMGRTATKIQNVFFKSILLHDWTRFVQLVAYDTGKGIVYRNLDDLANKNLSKKNQARLTDELNELGIDIEKGLAWVKSGGKHTDDFYMQEVRKAAARYTDEVIMNPTQAANQKPLLHSHPNSKWTFGLLGFPTSFSNTVLKNAAREVTKDLRSGTTSRLATPKIISGALVMTMAGLVGNIIRTRGRILEEYQRGEKPLLSTDPRAVGKESGLINDAFLRSGLAGPSEYYIRTKQAGRYQNQITAALSSITGPAIGDIIDYVRASQYRGATAEAVFRKAPFITVLRGQFPETYEKALKQVREIDATGGPDRPEEEVIPFSTGGLVSGPEVLNTKEDPADRKNPITGQPYSDKSTTELEMERLGFQKGGEVGMLESFIIEDFYKEPETKIVQEFRLGFAEGGDVIRYNNPGNIEKGQGYAGETGQFYAQNRERPFVVFDTPEAGMRAIVRDMTTKLNRYASFKDEAIDYALLEYLGGGRTGTKQERLKRAKIENPDTIGYLKEGSDLYKQKGMEGLLRTIINRENNPENAAFYNDNNLIKRALKISQQDFPTGTTSEEMFKLLNK